MARPRHVGSILSDSFFLPKWMVSLRRLMLTKEKWIVSLTKLLPIAKASPKEEAEGRCDVANEYSLPDEATTDAARARTERRRVRLSLPPSRWNQLAQTNDKSHVDLHTVPTDIPTTCTHPRTRPPPTGCAGCPLYVLRTDLKVFFPLYFFSLSWQLEFEDQPPYASWVASRDRRAMHAHVSL